MNKKEDIDSSSLVGTNGSRRRPGTDAPFPS